MSDWISILPNLSIGVVAIGALVFVNTRFLEQLEKRAKAHEEAMKEREKALRDVEADVRRNLTDQLAQNTIALTDSARIMERAIRMLDKK